MKRGTKGIEEEEKERKGMEGRERGREGKNRRTYLDIKNSGKK